MPQHERAQGGCAGFAPCIRTRAASCTCVSWVVDSFGGSQIGSLAPVGTKENHFSGSQRIALPRGEVGRHAVVQTAPVGCRTVPTGCGRWGSHGQMAEGELTNPFPFSVTSRSLCSGCVELGAGSLFSRYHEQGICGKSVPRTEDPLSQSLRCDEPPPLSCHRRDSTHHPASHDIARSEHGNTSSGAAPPRPPFPVRPF